MPQEVRRWDKIAPVIYPLLRWKLLNGLALAVIRATPIVRPDTKPYLERAIRGLWLASRLRRCALPIFVGRQVEVYSPQRVSIGRGTVLYDQVVVAATHGEVTSGTECHLDVGVYVQGSGVIDIGDECAIGAGVRIYSRSNQYTGEDDIPAEGPRLEAPVRLERGCWIGANAVILPGARLGEGAVVGALSTVKGVVPPYHVAVGSPARVLLRAAAAKHE